MADSDRTPFFDPKFFKEGKKLLGYYEGVTFKNKKKKQKLDGVAYGIARQLEALHEMEMLLSQFVENQPEKINNREEKVQQLKELEAVVKRCLPRWFFMEGFKENLSVAIFETVGVRGNKTRPRLAVELDKAEQYMKFLLVHVETKIYDLCQGADISEKQANLFKAAVTRDGFGIASFDKKMIVALGCLEELQQPIEELTKCITRHR